MRRSLADIVLAALVLALLGSYVWYTRSVVAELRTNARISSEMFARVYHAFGDTTRGAESQALLDLSRSVREQGVPLIWTDLAGRPAAHANLPFDETGKLSDDDPRVRAFIAVLAAQHPPVVDPMIGKIYYGDPRVVRGLRVIPVVQALTALALLLAGLFVIRERGTAARERLWAGMARESAHQLGTPLSSLTGWIELLEERADDPTSNAAVSHMRADLERLDRVAHRFERIGREPLLEDTDVGAIVNRVASYFKARAPTLAHTVAVLADVDPALPHVSGDPVLLEWAVEVLAKNAIDALAGRGGTIHFSASANRSDGVTVRVADDGPGIPHELRSRVFEPGFSTKSTGWGIGLSLAKRIVEENHGGKLMLVPSAQGATFEIILP